MLFDLYTGALACTMMAKAKKQKPEERMIELLEEILASLLRIEAELKQRRSGIVGGR